MANPLLLAQLQRNQHSMGTPISIANIANSQVIGTAAFSFARCHFFEFKVYWHQQLVARDHSIIHVARSPKSSV